MMWKQQWLVAGLRLQLGAEIRLSLMLSVEVWLKARVGAHSMALMI